MLKFTLLLPVLPFEAALRLLMRLMMTKDRGTGWYPLLGLIYCFCIMPAFYAILLRAGVGPESAKMSGYFFPPFISLGSVFNRDLFRIFMEVDPGAILWKAMVRCIRQKRYYAPFMGYKFIAYLCP
jgi:hypothetical protein